jgi:hypothetical protein
VAEVGKVGWTDREVDGVRIGRPGKLAASSEATMGSVSSMGCGSVLSSTYANIGSVLSRGWGSVSSMGWGPPATTTAAFMGSVLSMGWGSVLSSGMITGPNSANCGAGAGAAEAVPTIIVKATRRRTGRPPDLEARWNMLERGRKVDDGQGDNQQECLDGRGSQELAATR